MKQFLSLSIVLLLATIVFGQSSVTYSYVGNISITNYNDFGYSYTIFVVSPIPNGVIAIYSSVNAAGSSYNPVTGASNVVGLTGGLKFYTGTLPYAYIALVNVSASYVGQNYSGSISYSMLSIACVRIEERRPDGTVVRNVTMKSLAWDVSNGKNGDLSYVTATAKNYLADTQIKTGEKIESLYFVSNVIGKVGLGAVDAIVTPRTIESVTSIYGWQYASPDNNLVIIYGVGSGNIKIDTGFSAATSQALNYSYKFSSGVGDKRVYAAFSDTADVNGVKVPINVTNTPTADITTVLDDFELRIRLTGTYNTAAAGSVVEVSFPPGANKIIYDPTIGGGNDLMLGNGALVNNLLCVVYIFVVLLFL